MLEFKDIGLHKFYKLFEPMHMNHDQDILVHKIWYHYFQIMGLYVKHYMLKHIIYCFNQHNMYQDQY